MAQPQQIRWFALFLTLVSAGFIYGGWQQKTLINLSETAGGQYPYLLNAQSIATHGITRDFGDRNRMPLIPLLISAVYHEDKTIFADRSAWVAIISSVVMVLGISIFFFVTLSPAASIFLTLFSTVCIFFSRASFVQAELLYYTFFFIAWYSGCRVIYRPQIKWAVIAGITTGLAFWAKASVTPMIFALVIVMLLRSAMILYARLKKRSTMPHPLTHQRFGPAGICAVVVIIFFIIASPYLLDNKSKFDRFFYNVNSTFFMWCDSWQQAKSFADRYDISNSYPDIPPGQIPSLRRYVQTHSYPQAANRFQYGITTLSWMTIQSKSFKYFITLVLLAGWIAWKRKHLWRTLLAGEWGVILFCAILLIGYTAVYSWYTMVAYGDRFIQSLMLPVMVALCWFCHHFGYKINTIKLRHKRYSLTTILFIFGSGVLGIEGIYAVTDSRSQVDEAFIRFYFNESREAQLDGAVDVAQRGYRGVLQLDPTFALAHHEIGIIALQRGNIRSAIDALTSAVQYRPDDANLLNSLGSALIQSGQRREAVRVLIRATQINPRFSSAWYNLGGVYDQLGEHAKILPIIQHLETIDPAIAEQLRQLAQRK